MKLRFKRFSELAVAPNRAHYSDAGFDITATKLRRDPGYPELVIYETDLGVEVPFGYVGVLKERSSIRNHGLVLLGGVIDAGYTGKIEVSFQRQKKEHYWDRTQPYGAGDRICQLVIVPLAVILGVEEVDELSSGLRGNNGFGSTGA